MYCVTHSVERVSSSEVIGTSTLPGVFEVKIKVNPCTTKVIANYVMKYLATKRQQKIVKELNKPDDQRKYQPISFGINDKCMATVIYKDNSIKSDKYLYTIERFKIIQMGTTISSKEYEEKVETKKG